MLSSLQGGYCRPTEGIIEPHLEQINVLINREGPRTRRTGGCTDLAGEGHIVPSQTNEVEFTLEGHILSQLNLGATTDHPSPTELRAGPSAGKIRIGRIDCILAQAGT